MLISVDKQHELSWNPSWTDIWHYAVKNWCFFKAFNRGLDFQLVCSTRGAGLATQVCVTLPAQAVPPQTEVGRAGGPEERAGDSSSLAFISRQSLLLDLWADFAAGALHLQPNLAPRSAPPHPNRAGDGGWAQDRVHPQGLSAGNIPTSPNPPHCWLLSA